VSEYKYTGEWGVETKGLISSWRKRGKKGMSSKWVVPEGLGVKKKVKKGKAK